MICVIFIDFRTVLIVMTISDNVILNKLSKTPFLILHKRRNEFIEQIHTIVSVSQESNLRSEDWAKAPRAYSRWPFF